MKNILAILSIILFFITCKTSDTLYDQYSNKIKFNLNDFNHDGLHGPDGGLRSMDYEFCIPAKSEVIKEIEEIDPSLKVYNESKGRVGCSEDQFLCIGNTYQTGWKTKLLKLASKNYIEKIEQSFAE